ncbi:hypothetical protein N9242_03140 [Vicingaceae bacterium]|nr:hypothetical protein [Vicingaceae bacterium]
MDPIIDPNPLGLDKSVAPRLRMNSSQVQYFRGVKVPDSSNGGLIQQRDFDFSTAPSQLLP